MCVYIYTRNALLSLTRSSYRGTEGLRKRKKTERERERERERVRSEKERERERENIYTVHPTFLLSAPQKECCL